MKNASEIKIKSIAIIREYLVTTKSKQNLDNEYYSVTDLKKVCFLYRINLKRAHLSFHCDNFWVDFIFSCNNKTQCSGNLSISISIRKVDQIYQLQRV